MFSLRLKGLTAAVAVAVATTLGVGAASASTQIEGFTGFTGPNNLKQYSNEGYLYDPALRVNGQCYDMWCLNDRNNQGVLTTITEDGSDGWLDDDSFEIFGLYVNFNGKTEYATFDGIIEAMFGGGTVSEYLCNEAALSPSQTCADLLASGGPLSGYSAFSGTIFNLDGTVASGVTWDNTGYFLVWDDDVMANLEAFNIGTRGMGGTMRVDCIASSHEDNADVLDPQVYWDVDGGCGGPSEVPVPASLPLMASGLAFGGIAAFRRKRKQA